jgi:tRNA (guanosine-2'-O-)-methyltransferase
MTDRRKLAAEQSPKPSKWPRTSRRQERIEQVLNRRQPDLTVVLENVHDPHNASAVLRSCDAVGVLRICLVHTVETPPAAFARTTSASAAKWIGVEHYASIGECYQSLRATGFSIYATALNEESQMLFDVDFTKPTALVFGNEMRGLSHEAIAQADGAIQIPMMGMVQSLNISVACAVTLYEAMRQRLQAGKYDQPNLDPGARALLKEDWLSR